MATGASFESGHTRCQETQDQWETPVFAKEPSPEEEPKIKRVGGACGILRKAADTKKIDLVQLKPLWQEGKIAARTADLVDLKSVESWDGLQVIWDEAALKDLGLTLADIEAASAR